MPLAPSDNGMYITTSRMVKLAEKMNRTSEEIDAALQPDVCATRALQGHLHNTLDSLGRMLRPLT